MALHLRVVCPENEAFDGDIAFVTVPASDGCLGVAPKHSSEICTLEPGLVSVCDHQMGQTDHRIVVSEGYAQVCDDEIIVLAERAEDLAHLDRDKVQADLQAFEDKLNSLSEDDAERSYFYNRIAWCKLLLAHLADQAAA